MNPSRRMSAYTCIHVQPLQITKAASGSAGTFSLPPQSSSSSSASNASRGQTGRVMSPHTGQMTPPESPADAEAGCDGHGDFQTYLRAFYPYHPSHEEESSTQILPLNTGDLVLIHSIHTNGWADGTLLASGARGWLPTNYCEGYGSDPINSLLRALTTFWDLVKSSNDEGLQHFRHGDYVKGLVAGARQLLEKTRCLNRESHLVEINSGLRKNRKALLSDLSSFVKITKGLESTLNSPVVMEMVEVDLNEMILKAFRIVTRAVKFLDVWDDHMQRMDASVSQAHVPPTPPADHAEFGNAQTLNLPNPATYHNVDTSSSSQAHAGAHARDVQPKWQTNSPRPPYRRASQSYVRPGSSNSCRKSYQPPPSTQDSKKRGTHRVSCHIHPGSQDLASEKLTVLHNNFLTLLGYFIGLHLQSRSSTELLLTTKQSVLACKDMLELITHIWDRDGRRSRLLGDARDNMYRRIADLADAAHQIFRPLRSGDDDVVLPCDGKPLMDAATACVRSAGIAVADSRAVIERIGDFAFEPLGLGSTEAGSAGPARSTPLTIQEEQNDTTPRALPSLPAPSSPLPSSTSPHRAIQARVQPPEPFLETPIQGSPVDSGIGLLATNRDSQNALLPPLPPFAKDEFAISPDEYATSSSNETHVSTCRRHRANSVGVSSTGDSSTYVGSVRDSETSATSETSTRATSPDTALVGITGANSSFPTGCQKYHPDDTEDPELSILERSYAHELIYNKDGLVTGGTLPALIERLTTPDSTPDACFVSTFFLTFRLFATPIEFAQALIDRFQYVGESPHIAGPARLRVYNVFKGWLESHWRNDCDKPALDLVMSFANRQLQLVLPSAGKQLARLAEQVTMISGPLVPRLISSIGKTNTSIATYVSPDTPMPASIINKSQLSALSNWKHGGRGVTILDFDPLELARQFTIKESQIFCSILPEELLASEWTKKTASMAVNVRAMSRLSTDLANLVADSILQVEDPKKRAIIIKQWIKIGKRFLELANYHSLMAIVCSLNQSTIGRLKRTWEFVSTKTKATLESLRSIVDHDRNYLALRQRLQNHVPPCVPFVGLYLTDLTFVDAGNQTTRQLPRLSPTEESRSVINFDKHVKTAKIISELQRFQIPYRFHEIPELQTWMQDQLVRVRTTDQTDVLKDYYRRSLLLEPREQTPSAKPSPNTEAGEKEKDKFGVFSTLGWSHHSREKLTVT